MRRYLPSILAVVVLGCSNGDAPADARPQGPESALPGSEQPVQMSAEVMADSFHVRIMESADGSPPKTVWEGPRDFAFDERGLAWKMAEPRWVTRDSLTFLATYGDSEHPDTLQGAATRGPESGWALRLGVLEVDPDGTLWAIQGNQGRYPIKDYWGGPFYQLWLSRGRAHVVSAAGEIALVDEDTGAVEFVGPQWKASPSEGWVASYASGYTEMDNLSWLGLVRFTEEGFEAFPFEMLNATVPYPHTADPFGLVEGIEWVDDSTLSLQMRTIPKVPPEEADLSKEEVFGATYRLETDGLWHLYGPDGGEVAIIR